MTTQTRKNGFANNLTAQLGALVIVVAIVIAVAWRYAF
jgi:hypothetical protein